MDASNEPHVCFWDPELDALVYLTKQGDAWKLRVIRKNSVHPLFPSIHCAMDGAMHILDYEWKTGRVSHSIIRGDETTTRTVEGVRVETGWTSLVDSRSLSSLHVSRPDVHVDRDNALWFTYCDADDGAHFLVMLHNGEIVRRAIASPDNDIDSVRMRVAPDGEIHLSYLDYGGRRAKLRFVTASELYK